jgi:lactate dehydrogenase-like 2-hydroxyacid dehydrogenase
MGFKVLLTRPFPEAGIKRIQAECELEIWDGDGPMTREVLLQKVRGCDGLVTMLTEQIDQELMEVAGPQLKVVSNYAVGYNNIDVPAAKSRGIKIGNTPGALTEATADTAATLLLAAARHAADGIDAVKTGRWKCWEPLGYIGADLMGKTIGIVGMGRIGHALARRFHRGWDMNVIYTSRSPKPEYETDINAQRVDFDTLLKESDFVSIHCDLNPSTRGLFNYEVFQKMKRTAVLVNTARGLNIVQHDLYRALKEGLIASAGLDVTEPEPLPLSDPLLTLKNVVILPHVGSATFATRTRMAEIAAENLLRGLKGEPLLHEVTD